MPITERECYEMIERIEYSVTMLFSSRAFYREYLEIINGNPRLSNGNHFLTWVANNYLYSAAMSLRRLLDRRSDTISIYKLLDALQSNNYLLTKTHYISRFISDGSSRDLAELSYAKITGSSHARGLNLQKLRDQLDSFSANWERLKTYIDERIAHDARTPSQELPTIHDLDICINGAAEVMKTIIAFMTFRSIISFEPIIQYPWREIFSFPWIESL